MNAPAGAEDLLTEIYAELRRLAAAKMKDEREGHTLQPTALVHEVWLRLEMQRQDQFDGRTAYFKAAAETMRRVLIDRARSRLAEKRGSGKVDALEAHALEAIAVKAPDDEMVAVNDALDKLALSDPVSAELVKLRYFVGMTMAEAADALEMSLRATERRWTFCRAWLRRALQENC